MMEVLHAQVDGGDGTTTTVVIGGCAMEGVFDENGNLVQQSEGCSSFDQPQNTPTENVTVQPQRLARTGGEQTMGVIVGGELLVVGTMAVAAAKYLMRKNLHSS